MILKFHKCACIAVKQQFVLIFLQKKVTQIDPQEIPFEFIKFEIICNGEQVWKNTQPPPQNQGRA